MYCFTHATCAHIGPAGNGGTIYTRWGRSDCPNTAGTLLVYDGVTAGSKWNEGGGVDYLCLPRNPQYLQRSGGRQTWRARLYGAEYETGDSPPLNTVFTSRQNHNAPCAVCFTPARGTKLMIPGMVNCPSSWTREYYGYLMAAAVRHPHRHNFACVDYNAGSVPGSQAETAEAVFYHTETSCDGITCPPYVDGNELTCVMCTK